MGVATTNGWGYGGLLSAVVRRLRASDAVDLRESCFPTQALDAVQAYTGWCLRQMEKGRLLRLVAEVNGHAVANGQLTLQGDRAEIGSLIVAPAHRRRGIGRQLLRALVAEAQRHGTRTLVLAAGVQEPWLRAWYEREGFAYAGEHLLPRGERVSVLQMQLGEECDRDKT
jgi:ribosomal-protein-alanine N-acetyltransferase